MGMMEAIDYRAQQELEEERLFELKEILRRVARGISTCEDANVLAGELRVGMIFYIQERN